MKCLRFLPVLLILGSGIHGAAGEPLACSGGGEEELACWFGQGLDLQQRAEATETAEEKTKLLQEAALAYDRALAMDPQRGPALNNLAEVFVGLGRDADAEARFEDAVSLEQGILRPFYRANFGDFLARRGDWRRAAEQYQSALDETPDYLRAHEALTAILSQHRPEAFPGYLRFLISRGQLLWAEEIALVRLRVEPTEQYLSLLVESLAEQFPGPEGLLSERTAEALRNLVSQPEIGEGAREILLLNKGTDFDPASYRWWAERGQPVSVSDPSPRQAFRSLIRSFGEAKRQEERLDTARGYLQLAVTLSNEEPDLLAFRRMLDLPSAWTDVETIGRLAELNEKLLRKNQGPPREDLYRYRHDLGLYFAILGKWDREQSPRSATYQLKRATELSNAGNEIQFDARIYTRLMGHYVETNRQVEARRVWKNLADAYAAHDMKAESDFLLLAFPVSRDRPDNESTQVVLDDPSVPLDGDFTTEPPR